MRIEVDRRRRPRRGRSGNDQAALPAEGVQGVARRHAPTHLPVQRGARSRRAQPFSAGSSGVRWRLVDRSRVSSAAVSQPKVFISYRRSDSQAQTGRLYDRLNRAFPGMFFRDVSEIGVGVDFVAHVERAVGASVALIAVIGPGWVDRGRRARPAARRSPTTSSASRSAPRSRAGSASSRSSSATPRWWTTTSCPRT